MDTSNKPNANPSLQPESASDEVTRGDEKGTASNPIADAIDVFLHRCEDIKSSVGFVAVAAHMRKQSFDKLLKDLEEGEALLARDDANSVAGIRKTQRAILHLEHLTKSELPKVIEASLFLGLFSAFDAFTGRLMTAIYRRKPRLHEGINRTMAVSDILQFKSFEDLHNSVLRDEIEDLRRKSYVDQFKELETKFGIKLRVFDRWPQFVECAQRRNLLTHCDGEISEQYVEVCEREGYKFKSPPKIGKRLDLGPTYFKGACDLLSEVALKLGHTLWRKILPEEIEEADKELNEAIYNRLQMEDFEQARTYGQFAREQKHIHSELYRRMFVVNQAIALKALGETGRATALLGEMDWSACSQDFKLAEAVLTDRIEDACYIMRRIGRKGEMVKEDSYHVWPLFRTFRTDTSFLKCYESIYGRPFVAELQKAADKAQITAGEAVASTKSAAASEPTP